ncbi:MAG: hypothetical protein JW915_22940 [Chitinispirillaceae bacterium]|nr:hypothetical protein [Chitinispirillaceae bacterium]
MKFRRSQQIYAYKEAVLLTIEMNTVIGCLCRISSKAIDIITDHQHSVCSTLRLTAFRTIPAIYMRVLCGG